MSCLIKKSRFFLITFSFVILFFILPSSFFLPTAVQAEIPLSPLQENLREDIIGTGRQAAQIGLGEQAVGNLDIRIYALRFARGALAFVGLIFVIVIMYGGFQYLTSGGSEEKMEKGKTLIGRATVGMAIVLSSYAIAAFVSRQIVRITTEQMFAQVQNCQTQTGASACCREWNTYQNRISSRPIWNRSDDPEATRLYDEWRQCARRVQGRD